jgi:serine/threonine-protein kinase
MSSAFVVPKPRGSSTTEDALSPRLAFSSSPRLKQGELGGITLRETYRLLRPIGRGGMGTIYEALHLRLGHTVAVKLMAQSIHRDRCSLARFRFEAELLVQLRHPNIVRVLDYDTTPEGEPYIVMERIEGEPLSDLLDHRGRLSVDETTLIVGQIASALAHAHSRGVLHRDLKPSNVMLEQAAADDPRAMLLDFGIAKQLLCDPGLTLDAIVGTPEHMAPEQVEPCADVDHRVDQYALGLCAYEMLSGSNPFFDDSSLDISRVFRRIRAQDRPRLSIAAPDAPFSVVEVVERAMSARREDRFPDVIAFARELLRAAGMSSRAEPRQARLAHSERKVATDADALVHEMATAFSSGDLIAAFRYADLACLAGSDDRDGEPQPAITRAAALIEQVLVERLGGRCARIRHRARREAPPQSDLTPGDAFVLSRIDGAISIEDLVDVCPLPRLQTLRSAARLLERGLIAID